MGRLRIYLRTYRRSWHLTQEELAFLFGYGDQSIISRMEEEERAITLVAARACKLIFGVKPEEMFPALFAMIEDGVAQRMEELRLRLLEAKPTQKTLAKLELLNEALGRLSGTAEQQI